MGTVLIPAAIAAETPALRARLTGTYSMALSLGPALALGFTIPIMHTTGFDWHGTLAVWSAAGPLALVLWILYARQRNTKPPTTAHQTPPVTGPLAITPVAPTKSNGVRVVARDLQVWQLAVYLGITSVTFYASSTWLPTTFMMDGMNPVIAGSSTAIINIVAIPFAFIAPSLMRRGHSRILAPLAPAAAILGVVLLLIFGNTGALASVILLGISQGIMPGCLV